MKNARIRIIFIIILACLFVFFTDIETASAQQYPGQRAGTAPSTISLGSPVAGVKLTGPLAGKIAFVLPPSINLPNCWHDSAFWTGSELLYALTSISWTSLNANNPAYTPDPECHLPSGQNTPAFNIYAASSENGSWSLTRLAFNDTAHPFGAPKESGDHLAYVSFEKTPSNLGNIYLTKNEGTNTWSKLVPFVHNSSDCNEDNPDLYANGTKIIFESNRSNAAAKSCISNHQKLWASTLKNGIWSTPTLLAGAPALGDQSFQPWVDEQAGNLYWTGDSSVCGDGEMNCVLMAAPENEGGAASENGIGWSGSFHKIISPTPLIPGSADGKVVLVGEYSQANGVAFFECGIATETDPTGETQTLFGGRWTITMNICAVPLGR